jgi:uncharacterized membrane protein (DUF373 family)
MQDWTERIIERAENVVYLAIALVLFAMGGVVVVASVVQFASLPDDGVITTSAKILDLLLLVFIVVELLFAVRTTLSRRELVAEPFLLVGIIASIKEIVVLSVKAPDLLGKREFDDMVWLIGALTATILVLAASSWLLRRKEREPSEAANSGHGDSEVHDGDGVDDDPDGSDRSDRREQEREAAAGTA